MNRLAPFPGNAGEAADERQHKRCGERGQHGVAPAPHRRAHHRTDRPCQDRLAVQPSVQVFGQRQCTGIAAARLLLQALQADDLEVAGDLAIDLRWATRAVGCAPCRASRPAWCRRTAPGRSARRTGSCPGRRRRSPSRARPGPGSPARAPCTTASRSGCRMRQVAVGVDPLGQAEVGDVRLALLVEQDVRRLQVAVEDAALMGVMDRLRGDGDQPRRARESRRRTPRAACPGWSRRSASC